MNCADRNVSARRSEEPSNSIFQTDSPNPALTLLDTLFRFCAIDNESVN